MPRHEPKPIHHWDEALALVVQRHGPDFRKGTRVPYLTYVIAVAETLAYHYPDRDHLIVAGLLHDVVEDTDTSFQEIEEHFGAEVEALVKAVSKDDAAMAKDTDDLLTVLKRDKSEDEIHVIVNRSGFGREFVFTRPALAGPAVDGKPSRMLPGFGTRVPNAGARG